MKRVRFYRPTLEEASVKLLSVLLFPEDGLPTSPMRGSRGMARWNCRVDRWRGKRSRSKNVYTIKITCSKEVGKDASMTA